MNPEMGYTTKPLAVGAPLPEDMTDILKSVPGTMDIDAELIRAQVELMHAIARHRKAWAKARVHRDEARAKAMWAEAYMPYKEATADVRWWREEMTAQATTITALLALREQPVARTHQESPTRTISPKIRDTVASWEEGTDPTPEHIAAARIWMRLCTADLDHAGKMWQHDWHQCRAILINSASTP
jgi:hypothetical protein